MSAAHLAAHRLSPIRKVLRSLATRSPQPDFSPLGYNWQVAPRWVVGVVATGYLDSSGSFTCMQASPIIIGSNCEVSPRALATVAGRIGFLIDPPSHTLIYCKAGGAWMDSHISIHPNNIGPLADFRNAVFPGDATSTDAGAWGGMVGAGIERALTPAWSISLEYDYYRFALGPQRRNSGRTPPYSLRGDRLLGLGLAQVCRRGCRLQMCSMT